MVIPDVFFGLIQNAILLLCGWSTFKALETDRSEDDTHWLTFWLVYTFVAFTKSILDFVSFAIPFYNDGMIGLTIYLAFFGGADHIYKVFMKPFMKEHEALVDAHIAKAKVKVTGAVAEAKAKLQERVSSSTLNLSKTE